MKERGVGEEGGKGDGGREPVLHQSPSTQRP